MPRQLSVLSRTLLRQSSRVDSSTQTVNQSRQRILSSTSKELPSWALAFSSRRMNASAITSKPKDDLTLHSVGINWERGSEGEHQSDSYMQVLLEWKALQNQLKEKKAQVRIPVNDWNILTPAQEYPALPDYFASNTLEVPATHKEETTEAIIPKLNKKIPTKPVDDRLWITELDKEVLEKASRSALLQIRDGQRDMSRLADIFLGSLAPSLIKVSSEQTQREQARLFVFTHWISKASYALSSSQLRVNAVKLCVKVTADLYHSMVTIEGRESAAGKTDGLNKVRRSTLHRLFGLLYPYTRPQGMRRHVAIMCCQSLTLISKLLANTDMKPAQVRFLFRKYLVRLEWMVKIKKDVVDQKPLWDEAAKTFMKLIPSGVLTSPPTVDTDKSSTSSIVDYFFRLLCLATAKKHVRSDWSSTVILGLARASQVTQLQAKMAAREIRETGGTSIGTCMQGQDVLLSIEPFVSQSTMEEVVGKLCGIGKFNLAREIAFMAPKEQRSVQILSFLMRRWSSILPDFTAEELKKEEGIKGRKRTFRTCAISQRIWLEAVPLLDIRDEANLPALLNVINARMASHARSKAPRLVAADLDVLQRMYGKEKPMTDVLGLLDEQTQVEIVRAHSRAGSLDQATKWAHTIVSAARARQDTGNAMDADRLPRRVMNVLLSAYLKLKGNEKWFAALRRHSVLLRQGVIFKRHRVHFGKTVNRFLRVKKKGLIRARAPGCRKFYFRFHQMIDFLLSFATRHGIVPDHQTSTIVLSALLRLSPRFISRQNSLGIKKYVDFDWKAKGVSGVLYDIKKIISSGVVVPLIDPLSTEEGQRRSQMIYDAMLKRERRRNFGSHKTRRIQPCPKHVL